MAEEPQRIRQAGQDVLTGQGGVLGHDVIWAVTGSQELDHRLRGGTGARDDRTASQRSGSIRSVMTII